MQGLKKISTKFINYKAGTPQMMFIDKRQIIVNEGELLMKIKSIGINRAECLHRQGKYKINRQIQSYLGLQASGQVFDPITNLKLFDGMALLTGGAYSQWASIPQQHIIPIPKGISIVQAAGIPQAWITAFQLLNLAGVKEGDNVVIYAAASGVGTAAIQLAKLMKAHPFAVVSSQEKGKICRQLGAEKVVYYKNNPTWSKQLLQYKNGFEVVLDCVGSDNCDATLELLSLDGRWVLFGLLSGGKTNLNLASILAKRINIISTTLKTRTDEYKSNLISKFKQFSLQAFEHKKLKPIISQILKTGWQNADIFIKAHNTMESNINIGKILIQFTQ